MNMQTLIFTKTDWQLEKSGRITFTGQLSSLDLTALKLRQSSRIRLLLDVPYMTKELTLASLSGNRLRTALSFEMEKLYPTLKGQLLYDYVINSKSNSSIAITLYLVKESDAASMLEKAASLGLLISKIGLSEKPDLSLNIKSKVVDDANELIKDRIFKTLSINAFTLIFLVLSVFLFSSYFDYREKTDDLRLQLTELRSSNTENESYYQQNQDLFQDFQRRNVLLPCNIRVSDFIYELSDLKDKSFYLTKIEKNDKGYEIEGKTSDKASIFEIINKLNDLNTGLKADLNYSETVAGKHNVLFNIVLR